VGEKHQKSREGEVNHPQQGEWVKNIKKQGGGSKGGHKIVISLTVTFNR
jgi:hypothetical protein